MIRTWLLHSSMEPKTTCSASQKKSLSTTPWPRIKMRGWPRPSSRPNTTRTPRMAATSRKSQLNSLVASAMSATTSKSPESSKCRTGSRRRRRRSNRTVRVMMIRKRRRRENKKKRASL